MSAERLLVVEDDPALQEALCRVLELEGYQVTAARNGLEALAALEHGLPQLIISDIMMPRMDGYQLFEAVRARPDCLDVPFIFLSAKGDRADIRRGKSLGADDYVTKPFEVEDLLVAVRSRLDRQAQMESARERQVSDLKRTILTTLNHEFRTPLTYISSYAELLRDPQANLRPDELQSLLRGILAGSERLRRLVEDFIFLVELQAGETERTYLSRRAPLTDLPDQLRAQLQQFQPAARARGLTLLAEIPAQLPAVVADRELLLNAISRLLDNGLKFSRRSGGRVTLAADHTGGRLRISVQDEGIGIRPEAADRLFDVFYQIDRAKVEQQGSGSGLAIARGIVELHGGRLAFTTEFGVGSVFTIELPA